MTLRLRRLLPAIVIIAIIYTFHHTFISSSPPPIHSVPSDCALPPIYNDVLVILKTGITEARDKVPPHLTTTLRCIPNYMIYSDYAEPLSPTVFSQDILGPYISSATKATNPDFSLYNRVRLAGHSGLTPADLVADVNTPIGKPNNPGWKLDKWKFLPMVDGALAARPEAKWFVFMEADTYLLWANLAAWLARFDPRKPWYLGNQMQIVDALFAHGGSGFVLSRPAMEMARDLRAQSEDGWETAVDAHWAGDCLLGILLESCGVSLTWSWPMLQIAPPGEVDFFATGFDMGRLWCYPAVSFHHLEGEEDLRGLDRLEKGWVADGYAGKVMVYRDVFWRIVWGQIQSVKQGWDNLAADEDLGRAGSVDECREMCVHEALCLAYRFAPADETCWSGRGMQLGKKAEGFTSGWMTHRIQAVAESLGQCDEISWWFPPPPAAPPAAAAAAALVDPPAILAQDQLPPRREVERAQHIYPELDGRTVVVGRQSDGASDAVAEATQGEKPVPVFVAGGGVIVPEATEQHGGARTGDQILGGQPRLESDQRLYLLVEAGDRRQQLVRRDAGVRAGVTQVVLQVVGKMRQLLLLRRVRQGVEAGFRGVVGCCRQLRFPWEFIGVRGGRRIMRWRGQTDAHAGGRDGMD
ncbi:uncharacterized protein BO97DRAFT_478820 [Aspergillus homomorphus CBS 101889]|uniref:N-acetylgalactosaminide beta-1,3-galactosyltransferase n=1 Tax=Aspergillus homomorphus (strain CBS 101889) TaxID=1450537 RepID=A0A395HT33_ASPHC|nr:hypothetical protein BO97DRAFT_478820 [Aspergillus homomorphus CBS 101889]RAL10950.1 hypothetical protein BO97DRAFT_478820 [Aspergillus homomorphus CBS 101889]